MQVHGVQVHGARVHGVQVHGVRGHGMPQGCTGRGCTGHRGGAPEGRRALGAWVLPIPAEHPYSLLWGVRWASSAPFSLQVHLRDSCHLHTCPKGVLAKLGQVNWGEGSQRPLV